MKLELLIQDGSGRRLECRSDAQTTFGRTDRSQVVVPSDPRLSGLHFAIENRRGTWRVRDCRSTNGTFVNQLRIEDSQLRDGDVIRAGQTEFVVRIPSDDRSSAEPRSTPPRATMAAEPGRSPAVGAVTAPLGRAAEPDEDVVGERLAIENRTSLSTALMLSEDQPGQARLTVIVKATLTLESSPRLADLQLPVLGVDQPFPGTDNLVRLETDMVPFKPVSDIVLVGKAHAPRGRPLERMEVRLSVGAASMAIHVVGDRHWIFASRAQIVPVISKPEAFTVMELTYRRAFGGIDEHAAGVCAENLCGVGFIGGLTPKSIHGKPLPNLEDPRRLIHSWDDRPGPVGFGFYGRGWQPRLSFVGTFDEAYRKSRAPLPPLDASPRFYNGAHPRLQVEGYLRGDEDVELLGVTLDSPLRCRLTGLRPRVRIERTAAGRQQAPQPPVVAGQPTVAESSVRPPLDTLVFLPEERIFYQVYRAVFPLPSLDQIDVTRIIVSLDSR